MASLSSQFRKPTFLQTLARHSALYPWRVLAVAFLAAFLSVYYTIGHLDFKTSRNKLVAEKDPVVEKFSEISDDFDRVTNTIVAVEGNDPERMKSFVAELARRLEKEPQHFGDILYRIDTSSLDGKKLLYLSVPELSNLREKLLDYGELIEELAFTPRLSRILAYINQEISEAAVSRLVSDLLGGDEAPPGGEKEKDPVDLGFLRSLATEMRLALKAGYRFQSPWNSFFKIDKFSEEGFLVSEDERFVFMTLNVRSDKASTFTRKRASLERLRDQLKDLRGEGYADVQAGVTGDIVLSTDEMTQAMEDTRRATAIALAGIALLFMVVFRQVYNPLLVLVSLVAAICWTFGWLTATIGYLSILTVAFTPILLGLGVDFGIHILGRYMEERRENGDFLESLDRAYRHTGSAIIAGAATTSLAFFAILLTDFRGIRELGFIAGSGVLLSLLSTFTILPALLSLGEKLPRRHRAHALTFKANVRPLELLSRHWLWVLIIAGAATVFSLAGVPGVTFDYNLLNLQAEGTESVKWERKISEGSGRSSWFAMTTAGTLEEARRKAEAFKALPSVRKVDSFAELVPENQEERLEAVRGLQPLVAPYQAAFDDPDPPRADRIVELLSKIRFKLRSEAQWDPAKKPEEQEIESTRRALSALLEALESTPPGEVEQRWTVFQEKLFRDFSAKLRLLKDNASPPGPVAPQDVPPSLGERFIGKSGRYLLQIFSRDNIWEKEHMAAFTRQLRAVDPQVTGPPIVGFIAIDLMKRGYLQGGAYALLAVLVVVWVMFRRWKPVLFTLSPLVLTTLWTLGYMGWTRLDFNLANLIALPLVLGIVVDDGIHVTHRFREDSGNVESFMRGSTAKAITLTSWTTMIGFGSLLVAHHYGVFSVGVLITLAVGIAWILSLVFLPSLLRCRRAPHGIKGDS